jgi:hypothetical protein
MKFYMLSNEVHTVHTVEEWELQVLDTNEDADMFSDSISNCVSSVLSKYLSRTYIPVNKFSHSNW